jgi:hypothetical protein
MSLLKKILLVLLVLLCALLVFIYSKTPSNTKVWDVEFSKQTNITKDKGGEYNLQNIRDFSHQVGTTTKTEWTNIDINPADIRRMWFFVTYFSEHKEVAHTFISFETNSGQTVSFSIEARREAGEKYTFIDGFLNTYELQYLWGTERDFVSERVVKDGNPVYMYELKLQPETMQKLFVYFSQETNTLNAQPRFYHLLFANCTNMLAKIINTYYPNKLPYDISWNLTGLSPIYLQKQSYITEGTGVNLLEHRGQIASSTITDPTVYSSLIRSYVK